MNILLIGSGGREHAMAYKLTGSKLCDRLFIMPGNAGTAALGMNVQQDPNDFEATGLFCLNNHIGLVIVGPEDPLVKGIRNYFESHATLKDILFVGPGKEGAIMEGSKDWSKNFMKKYAIPTAGYATFTHDTLIAGIDYVNQHSLPIVLKADGLAAGKGVLICQSHLEAATELKSMIQDKKFGEASATVVVEEFLHGIELSVFVVTDGNNYLVLPEAKDYKRIGEGEQGLNTGGMGAISPVPFADKAFMQKVEERIIKPTISGLQKEQIPYIGFIFIGLMKVGDDPIVIEYNSRLGDPETEAVLPRIESDFVEMMVACAAGNLNTYSIKVSDNKAATIMLVSEGYPGDYTKGKIINGLTRISNSLLFHAGTKNSDQSEIITNGGRVLAVTSLATSLKEAVQLSVSNAKTIDFEGKYFRRDIGFEFLGNDEK